MESIQTQEMKDYDERYELWKAMEGYILEMGAEDDGKLDMTKFKKWCERKSIPLPKAVKDFEEQRKQ